jgi:diguanylate cyclase (GGDEF)-like protein
MRIALGQSIAVLMIDLDHFKSINDRYGHSVGDRVLQIFANTAGGSLRSFDLIGRLGGEEFAVAVADGNYDNVLAVAERICREFADAAAVVDGHAVGATTSIGVALINQPADEVSLLGEADKALYLAKDRGRNRVEVCGADKRAAAIVAARRSAA